MKALPVVAALALLAAAPAAAQDLQWGFRTSPGHSHLSYAMPDSDVGDIWMKCRDASGQISLSAPFERQIGVELRGTTYYDAEGRPAPWPSRLTLSSGQHRAALAAQAYHDESRQGSFLTVDFPMGGPILREFTRSGQISASAFGETQAPPAAPPELVRQFIEACQP